MSKEQKSERKTSAEIKKEIEQAHEDLKNSSLPVTGMLANEVNANPSTPDQSSKTDVKPDRVPPAANGSENPKTTQDVDLKEWAKKRGIDWTTEESVLSALRKSDQAFHERRQRDKEKEPTAPPTYQQPYPSYQQPAPYNPPVPKISYDSLGREYNMPAEDAERLLKFNQDFYEAKSQADRARYQKDIDEIKKENQKNSVFRELSSDPLFRKPEVGSEFNRVLEEMQNRNPQSFEQNPNEYKRAYDQALINIARRDLAGQPLEEGISPIPRPPTMPPRQIGKGSGGGAQEDESGFDREAFFKLKTSEEKRAVFEKMGIIAPY